MCDKTFSSEEGLKEHIKDMHGEILSPVAKKPKQSKSEMDTTEFSEDCEEVLKDLEMNSWEEIRLSHRGVEIKVNEEEVDKMEEYDEQERKNKVEEELENKKHDEMEKLNDEKVIRKQRDWFEEEVRYQEMKKKYSEEKEKEDLKRKRQLSHGKKKKSKPKRKDKENEDIKKQNDISSVKDIPDKLEPLFEEAGLKKKDFKI